MTRVTTSGKAAISRSRKKSSPQMPIHAKSSFPGSVPVKDSDKPITRPSTLATRMANLRKSSGERLRQLHAITSNCAQLLSEMNISYITDQPCKFQLNSMRCMYRLLFRMKSFPRAHASNEAVNNSGIEIHRTVRLKALKLYACMC